VSRRFSQLPEVYCDLNARMNENGYSLERRGSVEDLAKHGLTLEAAVGKRFTFYMDDGNDNGEPDDIMWEGVVVHDDRWGYLAQSEGGAFYHRSELVDGDA
jgi:hypothetical protein